MRQMTKLTSLIFLLLSFTGFAQTAHQLYLDLAIARAKAQAQTLIQNKPRLYQTNPIQEIEQLYASWKKALPLGFPVPEVSYGIARAALLRALVAKPDLQLPLVCEAFQRLVEATHSSPHVARYHIALADLQTQLPHPEITCLALENEAGSSLQKLAYVEPSKRLAWALSLGPWATTDLYLASLVYLNLGQKMKALELLRINQHINPYFTTEQRNYAAQLVTSKAELEIALPRQYPEILSWVHHFFTLRRNDYLRWKEVFVTTLDAAINEVIERFHARKLAPEHYSAYIKSIATVPLSTNSDLLRRHLDALLADIYEVEGQANWARILRVRKDLNRIPVLKAAIADDRLPLKTMLFGWVEDDEQRTLQLDVLGQSLGIFLPEGMNASMVILQNQGSSGMFGKESLEILVSDDNLNFHPSRGHIETQVFFIDGRETVALLFEQTDFCFLKIRYTDPNQKAHFENSLTNLIQVYGKGRI